MMNGMWIATTVMAAFEVEDDRIKEMREAYDLQSLLDQMQAATGDATR
jgi:limonene-1,2-epoxide hydrolase